MSGNFIVRDHYMKKFRDSRNTPFIKVITGIRRSGKSTLMKMFIDELKESGIRDDRILHIDFDDLMTIGDYRDKLKIYSDDLNSRDLIEIVRGSIEVLNESYLFFDEIQNVDGWEEAITAFYTKGADVYITGSNSNLLSSELATKLSGRCIEIPVYTLTFSEYKLFRENSGIGDEQLFEDYIRRGGFPAIALSEDAGSTLMDQILEGIYATVYNKDVLARNNIRNIPMMNHLCRFLMKNIGDRTSVRKATRYLNSNSMHTQPQTVDQYLDMLESAFLFHRAKRLDSKTKEYLRTSDKFYTADLGIRHTVVPFSVADYDGMIENIVFMELKQRFGDVAVCSVEGFEVDFIANPIRSPSYYQVTMSILDSNTREREVRSLKALDDNYPKTMITMDHGCNGDIDGIRVINLIDWLLESY